MFSADVPPAFSRDMGATPAEWDRALAGAVQQHRLERHGERAATVHLAGGGTLALRWQVLPPRAIALMRMPRLQVDFAFDGVDDAARAAFMRWFDLYTQRGGG